MWRTARRIGVAGLLLTGTATWGLAGPGAGAAEIRLQEGFGGAFGPVQITDPRDRGRIGGQLAVNWSDNSSWADVAVEYGPAPAAGPDGSQALRVAVTRVADGRVQLVNRSVRPQVGEVVTLSLALRSPQGMGVEVLLRQGPAPYATYWTRTLMAGPAWETHTFEVPVTFTDADCFLMFALSEQGELFLDNVSVSVAPLAAWARERLVRAGNLVRHSRFPLGVANGWCVSHAGRALNRAVVDLGVIGPSGSPALRLEPAFEDAVLLSPPVPHVPDVPYDLSFAARAEEPNRVVTVRILGADLSRTFTVGTRWQRYHWPVRLGGQRGGMATLSFAASQRVWLDTVQMAEGEQEQAYRQDLPELHLAARDFKGLQLVDGGPSGAAPAAAPPLKVAVHLAGRVPDDCRLTLEEVDVFGVRRSFAPIPADRLRGRTVDIDLPARPGAPMGSFRIRGEIVTAAGQPVGALSEVVVHRLFTPPRLGRLTPASPFGIHVSPTVEQCRMAALLGFKWVRVHDAGSWLTNWLWAEPERGKWQWHDDPITLYRRHGLLVLGMLGTAPTWASVRPSDGPTGYYEGYFLPKDLAAWREYVGRTVAHYRPLIQHWEVWNEPWVTDFFCAGYQEGKRVGGTPQQYTELLQAAYAEAHAAFPDVTVLGPCTTPAAWTRGCLDAKALTSIDVFSYHQYTGAELGYAGDAKDVLRKEAVDVQAQYGQARPVWNSEGGPGLGTLHFYDRLVPVPADPAADLASRVVRLYVSELGGGSERFFLYTMHGYGDFLQPSWSVMSADGTVHPLAAACSTLAHWVEGRRCVGRVEVRPGMFAFLFEGGKGSVAVLLPHGPGQHTLRYWPGPAADMMGNPLTWPARLGRYPVYVTSDGRSSLLRSMLEVGAVWDAAAAAAPLTR